LPLRSSGSYRANPDLRGVTPHLWCDEKQKEIKSMQKQNEIHIKKTKQKPGQAPGACWGFGGESRQGLVF
jgi:hypothetical protein